MIYSLWTPWSLCQQEGHYHDQPPNHELAIFKNHEMNKIVFLVNYPVCGIQLQN